MRASSKQLIKFFIELTMTRTKCHELALITLMSYNDAAVHIMMLVEHALMSGCLAEDHM